MHLQKFCLISMVTTVWVMGALLSVGICQEGSVPAHGETGFGILPITRALTEMPMPISFNGSSDPYLAPADSADISDSGRGRSVGHAHIRLPLAAPGLNAQLNRIRGIIFRYIQVGPSESMASDNSAFDLPPAGMGHPNNISLEFQADVTDLSGALFIVMTL